MFLFRNIYFVSCLYGSLAVLLMVSDVTRIHKWRLLTLLILVSMLVQTNVYLLIPNFQLIAQDFSVEDVHLGLMSGLYLLIVGLSMLFWGYLIDKTENRKAVLIIGIIGACASTFAAYLARDFLLLMVAQISTGFFIGVVPPTIYSMITDAFKPGERVKAINLWNFMASLGSGIGFALGLISGTWLTWKTGLYYGAVLIFLAIFFALIIKEPPRGAAEEGISDLVLQGKIKYHYKFSIEELKKDLSNNHSTFLLLSQAFLVYIAWGSFSIWGIHAVARELNTTTTVATVVLGIASGGAIGAFVLAPIADKLRLMNPKYKIYMVAFCLSIDLIGIISMFLLLPPINIYEDNVISAVLIVLHELNRNFAFLLAVLTGFTGLFAWSIVSPIRDSALADVNRPEYRATINAVTGISSLIGRSTGVILTGLVSTMFLSLKTAIILAQLTLIPAIIIWLWTGKYYSGDIKRINEILKKQLNARGNGLLLQNPNDSF